MIALLNAIYSQVSGVSSLVGGVHRDRAPEGTAMPFAVSKVVSSVMEQSYGAEARTRTDVRFSVVGVGHDAVGAIALTLAATLQGGGLTLSSGVNDSITRMGDPTPALLSADGQGNDVWDWSFVMQYEVVGPIA